MLLEEERGVDGRNFVAGVIREMEASALSHSEKILFRFVDKVNRCSNQITAEDMQPLRTAGWNDAAIYYAITVCALFNFYNRWIDASGVHVLSEEAHRAGGARSARTGYIRT